MRLDTRRATRPLCLDGPAARNDQQPGRTNSRSSPLVISLARWPPIPCRLGTWPAATTAVNTNTTCRQGDRHPSPASVSITNPDDCRASYHRPRPGGLDDLPKPDSATHSRKKKALALVSGGKETDQRIHAPAGPVCLPFHSRTPPPPPSTAKQQQTRETTNDSVVSMEMHSHRQHRSPVVPAHCPRRKSCPSEPNGVGSFGIGAGIDKLAAPTTSQRGSLQGDGGGRGRR